MNSKGVLDSKRGLEFERGLGFESCLGFERGLGFVAVRITEGGSKGGDLGGAGALPGIRYASSTIINAEMHARRYVGTPVILW